MADYQLGIIEKRFAEIIWDNEPITTKALVEASEKQFNWKKSTTYTVLKRLCEKGLFKNENGTVTSVITKDEFYSIKSEAFIEETFNGSLPAFLAAFTKNKSLTNEEVKVLKEMIKDFKEE